jgi:hypothetical protein
VLRARIEEEEVYYHSKIYNEKKRYIVTQIMVRMNNI